MKMSLIQEKISSVSVTPACIRAIKSGIKTQIRIVAKYGREDICPFGSPEDTLWIKESWGIIRASGAGKKIIYEADYETSHNDIHWMPAKEMAEWAVRIFVKIKNVHLEKLQSIPEKDIISEGKMWREKNTTEDARNGFIRWWNEVHSKNEEKWEKNSFVWVIEFENIKQKD
jgi:hypothetical protein